jgi:hypothetical protein
MRMGAWSDSWIAQVNHAMMQICVWYAELNVAAGHHFGVVVVLSPSSTSFTYLWCKAGRTGIMCRALTLQHSVFGCAKTQAT